MDNRRKSELDEHLEHCERQRQWLASLSPEERYEEEVKAENQRIEGDRRMQKIVAEGFLNDLKQSFDQINRSAKGLLLKKAKEDEATIIYWLLNGCEKWREGLTRRHENLFWNRFHVDELRTAHLKVSQHEEPVLVGREYNRLYAHAWAYGRYLAWLQGVDNKLSESRPEAKTFEELFLDPNKIKPCIAVLNQLGKGPIIDDRNEYAGSPQKKSIVGVWFDELRVKGWVSNPGSETVAKLANAYFPGLNASEKVFRGNVKTQTADDVRVELLALLSDI